MENKKYHRVPEEKLKKIKPDLTKKDDYQHGWHDAIQCIQDIFPSEEINKSEWVSAKDELPEDHMRFLCMAYLVNCFVEAVCLYDKEKQRWIYERNEVEVTHWQPLPPKPTHI